MMVRQMKEDAKGKSEEELAECFRIFDRCAGGPGRTALHFSAGAGREGASPGPGRLAPACPESHPVPSPPQERGRLHRCGGAG